LHSALPRILALENLDLRQIPVNWWSRSESARSDPDLSRIDFALPSLSWAAKYETQKTVYCSLDEVTITREGDYACIAYKEEGIGTTCLQIGPEIGEISDREILE
jgi:hypothetical protein